MTHNPARGLRVEDPLSIGSVATCGITRKKVHGCSFTAKGSVIGESLRDELTGFLKTRWQSALNLEMERRHEPMTGYTGLFRYCSISLLNSVISFILCLFENEDPSTEHHSETTTHVSLTSQIAAIRRNNRYRFAIEEKIIIRAFDNVSSEKRELGTRKGLKH